MRGLNESLASLARTSEALLVCRADDERVNDGGTYPEPRQCECQKECVNELCGCSNARGNNRRKSSILEVDSNSV